MSTLSSHHNAHIYACACAFIHNCKSPNTHALPIIMDMKSLNCSLVWTMNVRAFSHSENCHFIEWNEYEQALHMLPTLSIGPIRYAGLFALYFIRIWSCGDARSKFSPAAFYVVYVCNMNETNCVQWNELHKHPHGICKAGEELELCVRPQNEVITKACSWMAGFGIFCVRNSLNNKSFAVGNFVNFEVQFEVGTQQRNGCGCNWLKIIEKTETV